MTVADSARRMRHLTIGFAACLGLVFLRLVMLECSQGSDFRAAAAKPLEKQRALSGVRGRILSRDGQVLAFDQRVASLAVHYRYLEEPPGGRWLRSQARARVGRVTTDRTARLAAELEWIRAYRTELLDNLARLCGRPLAELEQESQNIQNRVRAISTVVNRARRTRPAEAERAATPVTGVTLWDQWIARAPEWLFAPDEVRDPPHVVVAEEMDYHVLVPDVPLEVVAEIESRPEHYPGVRIVEQSRRRYPQGVLAANVLGHLGMPAADDLELSQEASSEDVAREQRPNGSDAARGKPPAVHPVGRLGAERQFEMSLRGRDGQLTDQTDHSGRWLASIRRAEPATGCDVVLTLDARLQGIAESQLDRALVRSARAAGRRHARAGGAIVILDVHSGAILAAATAPRFDPNLFASREAASIDRLMADLSHPLFDRTTKMAIPPGSVFKVVTALALMADPGFDQRAAVECQGFLAQPDRQRCQIFRRYGLGHGPVNLADALVQSCNVYFFQHAESLGMARLTDWAARLGFGQATGIDLPGEAAGFLPTTANPGRSIRKWELVDTQALVIGQSTLTATPLQVARLMAAIGNGGRLVTPHVAVRAGSASLRAEEDLSYEADVPPPSVAVRGLGRRELDEVRRALARVVDDPQGTAYATLADSGVVVAGKTGTAETGETAADHAWFAGYAPADSPRVALAVALEHQGSADQAAVVVKELVQAMQALGMLSGRDKFDVAADQ